MRFVILCMFGYLLCATRSEINPNVSEMNILSEKHSAPGITEALIIYGAESQKTPDALFTKFGNETGILETIHIDDLAELKARVSREYVLGKTGSQLKIFGMIVFSGVNLVNILKAYDHATTPLTFQIYGFIGSIAYFMSDPNKMEAIGDNCDNILLIEHQNDLDKRIRKDFVAKYPKIPINTYHHKFCDGCD